MGIELRLPSYQKVLTWLRCVSKSLMLAPNAVNIPQEWRIHFYCEFRKSCDATLPYVCVCNSKWDQTDQLHMSTVSHSHTTSCILKKFNRLPARLESVFQSESLDHQCQPTCFQEGILLVRAVISHHGGLRIQDKSLFERGKWKFYLPFQKSLKKVCSNLLLTKEQIVWISSAGSTRISEM